MGLSRFGIWRYSLLELYAARVSIVMECVDSRLYCEVRGVHNIRALNISRGNPSLTDSVRLELLLIFDPLMTL